MASKESYPKYKSGVIINAQNYTCKICCINRKKIKNLCWDDHLETEEHKSVFELYKKSFTDLDDDSTIKCKICYQIFDRLYFYPHAVGHKLIPWYHSRPEMEKKLFLNFMSIENDDEVTCHVCDVKFKFLYQAVLHADEQEHLDQQEEKFPNYKQNNSISMNEIDYYCERFLFLISQDIFYCWLCETKLLKEKQSLHCLNYRHMNQIIPADYKNIILFHKEEGKIWFSCEICECKLKGIGPVFQHLDGEKHKKKCWEKKTGDEEKDEKNLPACVEEFGKNSHKCRICKVSWPVSVDFTRNHVNGIKHKNNILVYDEKIKTFNESLGEIINEKMHKVLPIGGEKLKIKSYYFCSTCDKRFDNINEANHHLAGSVHKNKLRELMKKVEDCNLVDLPTGIIWITTLEKNQGFKCSLCCCKMNDVKKMILHIDTPQHMMKLIGIYSSQVEKKVFLSFGVSQTALSHVYYCEICHQTIRGYKKLGKHIENKKHKIVMEEFFELGRKLSRNKNEEIDVDYVKKYAKNCDKFPNEIKNVDNNSKNYWWCAICNCNLYQPYSDEFFNEVEEKIWMHINGVKHQTKLWMKKSDDEETSRVSSTSSNGGEEKLVPVSELKEVVKEKDSDSGVAEEDEVPLDNLYDIQMKDDDDIAVASCLPCQLHFYGGTLTIIQDWNAHLMTELHRQKEAIFLNKKKIKKFMFY